jgi:hypothetical protein
MESPDATNQVARKGRLGKLIRSLLEVENRDVRPNFRSSVGWTSLSTFLAIDPLSIVVIVPAACWKGDIGEGRLSRRESNRKSAIGSRKYHDGDR